VFPLAALLARADLDIMADRALGHYTHEKNPVACAAGLATLECIQSDGLLENARLLGEHALRRIDAMKDKYLMVAGGRGLGLLLGIELVKDKRTREKASDAAERVMYRALEKGLSFKVTLGNILTLTPPLTITRAEMDRALNIIDECIAEVSAG
jgi:4-aminobutyrate aminotransferase